MKAFDTAWEEVKGKWSKYDLLKDIVIKPFAMLFWKMALEWAKSMARDNMLHGANINIWDEIEEELKQ